MSRRSMTRDIHESIRLILGKHAKILLKVPVKLEKGGSADKTENRILVFTAHRLFVMTSRVPARYACYGPILPMTPLNPSFYASLPTIWAFGTALLFIFYAGSIITFITLIIDKLNPTDQLT